MTLFLHTIIKLFIANNRRRILCQNEGNPIEIIKEIKDFNKNIEISKENETIFISVKSLLEKAIEYRVVLYEGKEDENKIDDTNIKASKSGYINYNIRDLDNRSNSNYKVIFYNNRNREEIVIKFILT